MTCNGCQTSPCCCHQLPPACNCPPSPQPPWSRPVQSPLIQTLSSNLVPLVLDPSIAYLSQTSPTPVTNNMAMPNGNYLRQQFTFIIPNAAIATTVTWVFTGNFAGGFTMLTFNTLGYTAVVEWDGSAWQLMSGNATLG